MKKSGWLLICLSFVITGTCFSQTIRISVRKGQQYKVQQTDQSTSLAEISGQNSRSLFDSKSTTLYEIGDITGNEIHLVKTTIKADAVSSAFFGTDSFVSQMPLPSGSKTEKKITINDKGIITQQDNIQSQPKFSLSGFGSADDNKEKTDLFIPVFIGRELKVNDSFADSNSLRKDSYIFQEAGIYTVTKVEEGIAHLSYTGTQLLSWNDPISQKKTSSSDKVIAQLKVDLNTGIMLEKHMVAESTIFIEKETKPSMTSTMITDLRISRAN